MLTIRAVQMHAFRVDLRRMLVERMAQRLRVRFAGHEKLAGNPSLAGVAEATLDIGARHGIRREDELNRLAEYVLLFGPRLDDRDDHPWIRECLQAVGLNPEQRLDRLDSYYTFAFLPTK